MKKMCNRVLAMLLTVVMMLSVLPLSVFASWLDVEAENTQSGNVASSDIKVTVSAKEFLSYLKDGDLKGLLKGVSVDGLRGAVSVDELFEIIPKEQFAKLVDIIVSDVKAADLLQYVDVNELLKSVDTDALAALVKGVDNLQGYVTDYDALMNYIDKGVIADALEYIDVEALADDYAEGLIDLALTLDAEDLAKIVDVDAVLAIDEIDFAKVLDVEYFKALTNYMDYVDDQGLSDFVLRHYNDSRWSNDAIHHFVNDDVLANILKGDAYYSQLINYVSMDALKALIEAEGIGYAEFVDYLDVPGAQAYMENKYAGDMTELLPYYDATMTVLDIEALFNDGKVTVAELLDNDLLDAAAIVSGEKPLFPILKLETAGVIDFKTIVFGNPTENVDPLFANIDVLLDSDAINLRGMVEEWTDENGDPQAPLFTIEELVAEGVILEEKLIAEGHTYDKLVDVAALETQLRALLDADVLTVADVTNCLVKKNGKPDYLAAINAIDGGLEAVVNSTDLTYAKILSDYVIDFNGLLNKLNVVGILREIVTDGKVTAIFDIRGLVEAIGVKNLIKLVDIKALAKELLYTGKDMATGLINSLSADAYIAWMSELLNIISRNVQAIKINGVTVTDKPFSDVLQFNSEKLLACVQAAVPTLNDLANLDDEGTLLSLSFAITYASDATGGVSKTKEIGVSFCVAEGADIIRSVAAKTEKLLGKFLTYSYNNGDVAINVKIPDEFATVIAYALNTLGDSADPELVALKDELLGLYDANLSDLANFVDNVTFGQIITILEKIDSAHFERAYNTVLRQRYVALMVDYIAEATGVDLSALPLDVLVGKLENIPTLPTLEQIAGKIEEITGRDLVSKLPQRVQNVWLTVEGERVTDLISRLAARYGADFDLQAILEAAADSEDPIQYLYDTLVEKLEMAEFVYNAASSKVMSVANRLLASSIGQKLDTIHLNEYYRGNGTFGFNVDATFSPEAVLQKGIDKIVNFVLSKRAFNTEYIDKALTIVYGMISGGEVGISFDGSVTVSGLYKAEFYDEDGNLIDKVFLPAGANLGLMVGEYAPVDPDSTFLGWKDATSESTVYYTVMPYSDIKLIADVDTKDEPIIPDTEYTVTVIDPDTKATVLEIVLKEGESLAAYKAQLEALVGTLAANQTLTWHKVVDGVTADAAYDLNTVVTADMTLTWKITTKQDPGPDEPDVYYNVTVDAYDENGEKIFEMSESLLAGTSIGGVIGAFDLVGNDNYPVLEDWEKVIYKLAHTWTNADGSALDMGAVLTGDLALKVVIARDLANATLKLDADNSKYSVTYVAPYYYVTWHADAWDQKMDLTIDHEFLEAAIANGYKLVMNAEDTVNGHSISLDTALLTNLLAEMDAKGVENVVLSYSFDKADETSGANVFSFSFLFDGTAYGDFFGNGRVEIRMPFAGQNSTKVKTYLFIDGVETLPTAINAGSVVIAAPHFSEFKLVNKYQLSYTTHKWEGVDESLLGSLANATEIATKPIAEGYYEAGEVLTVNAATVLPIAEGAELLRTTVLGMGITFAADSTGTFTMPAEAVTLQHVVTVKTYYIYYYVGGALDSSVGYTKFSVPTWAEIAAHVPTTSVAAGGSWFGIDTTLDLSANLQDLYLFLTWEGEDKVFTMSFTILDAQGQTVTFTIEHTVAEWLEKNLALIQAEIDTALLANGISGTRAIAWLNNGVNLNDYTMDDWKALMNSADSAAFVGEYVERKYTIYSDGNLTLSVGDSVAAGTTVTFTVIEKTGMKATVSIFVNGIETVLTGTSFEMPEGDVVIKVKYASKSYSYVDANGVTVNDALYGDRVTFTVTIPAGKVLPDDIDVAQLAGAPAGLSLIAMTSGSDGSLILTYAFDVNDETNGVNIATFVATVRNFIVDLEYKNVYMVDGKAYPSKKAAEAALPEGVVVKEWKQVDKNLFVAVLAYEGEESPAVLITLIIILLVLILILVIALLYTLYICGKLAPNWFLKVITVIVTAFFKACMAVAAAGLAIARLFGYEEADLVEEDEEPAEEPVVEEPAEEATEEEAPEATEEATEEVVEEVEPEATEEVVEEAAAEEVVEEAAAEEVVEEATEEADADTTATDETNE
ncbi:MAG: hypothetical protein IJW29_09960 [Clostridia bacterium]|nr:hypothetical protein [Clostridia bacterium]MBQ9785814.1 hypothetical protein [Clostridia bacterium]